jgi:hypothetical protein
MPESCESKTTTPGNRLAALEHLLIVEASNGLIELLLAAMPVFCAFQLSHCDKGNANIQIRRGSRQHQALGHRCSEFVDSTLHYEP